MTEMPIGAGVYSPCMGLAYIYKSPEAEAKCKDQIHAQMLISC